jgi:TPR repeat protein
VNLLSGQPSTALSAVWPLLVLLWLLPLSAVVQADGQLRDRAEAGDPWAQLNLGAAYDHGLAGISRDPAQAVIWYRRAAEAGLAEAQFNLAHCLASGQGAPRDDAAAALWMQRAAEQGLADAGFLYGVMLLEGVGVAVDRAGARDWLRRAAAQGQADARALLRREFGAVAD